MFTGKPLQFRVRYTFEIDGVEREGIETEASWYYIDQRGCFYSNRPFQPIMPIREGVYKELQPLIKIGDEYLTVEEIEERMENK